VNDQPAPSFRRLVTRYFTYRTPAAMICDGSILLILDIALRYLTFIVRTATSDRAREDMTALQAATNPYYLLFYISDALFYLAVVVAAAGILFEAARRVAHARDHAEPPAPVGDGTVMP
jgi:hypothetical protein